MLLRGISCSLFAVVKLITDHLREISTMEMYTVPVYAQEVDLSPSHQQVIRGCAIDTIKKTDAGKEAVLTRTQKNISQPAGEEF